MTVAAHFLFMNAWAKNVMQVGRAVVVSMVLVLPAAVWCQMALPKPAADEAKPEPPKDTLGRITPRGAVMGFLTAARKDNTAIAALYLNTPLRGEDAEELARQLAIVLDRRLPARLNELSDNPEGSLPDPLKPDEDLVGTISTSNGDLDILLERVDRGKAGKVWMFSRKTLITIPDVFAELNTPPLEKVLPQFLVKRIAGVQMFEWLAVFVGLPCLYLLTGLLDRLIGFGVLVFRRRILHHPKPQNLRFLPAPLRLLLLALSIRLLMTEVGLSLLARQFWSTTALIIAICAAIWLLILLNGWGEHWLIRHRARMNESGAVLRLVRRVMDGLVIFAGLIFTLYHFGINPSAALAGLGVGGIAVALAAQKTLENLIAGISLVADRAVHVGDFLKVGDMVGTVEEVGLRSTRIRTLDRSVLCVPNGQISNMSLETLSARDMFWFHPAVSLRLATTPSQMRSIVAEVRKLLIGHTSIDSSSVRVRFLRIGPSSLDVEIFSYVFARDWNQFLEIQEELLLNVIEIIHQTGAEIAFPSQTMYLAADSSGKLAPVISKLRTNREGTSLRDERNVHH